MNSIVFVLIVIANNGHFSNNVMPAMEFGSREKCERAIQVFENESKGRQGYVNMRCVAIEK